MFFLGGVELVYTADFDHSAPAGGTQLYANPHLSGEVVATMSSTDGNGSAVDRFVQHTHPGMLYNKTFGSAGSWMAVALGAGRALRVSYYTLRHDQHGTQQRGGVLRNWRLEGSPDGARWSADREHTDDAGLANATMVTASWPVNAAEAFQHFRILQTGKNSKGTDQDHLMCAGIELYGRLRED